MRFLNGSAKLLSAGLLASLGVLSPNIVKADLISSELGLAGPSNYAILALSTSNHLHINGPAPQGTTGNIGVVASSGDFQLTHPSSVTGNILVSGSSTEFQYQPGTLNGNVVPNDSSALTSANYAAFNAASYFSKLTQTQSAGNAFTNGGTINAVNNGGVNVIAVNNINLGGNNIVTLHGSAGTEFIINDTGDMTLNSGQILLSGGLTAQDVVFNLSGKLQTSGGLNNESVITGIVLDTSKNDVHLSPGLIKGELISGGAMEIVSGGQITVPKMPGVPEPSSITLLGLGGGLVFSGLLYRSRSKRRKVADA